MPRSIPGIVVATGLGLTLAAGAAADPAAATTLMAPGQFSVPAGGSLVSGARFCRCERDWGPRLNWQWGWHHPPWQTPWNEPTYFWSLDPPRVPADVWARKWHPPRIHGRRRHFHRTGGR